MADIKCKLKTVLTTSIVGNCLLIITFIVLTLISDDKIVENLSLNNNDHRNKSVCFTCEYLGKSIKKEDTIFTEITTTKCGRRVCCIEEQSVQSFVTQLLFSDKDLASKPDLVHLMAWWRERKNAAHLFIQDATDRGGNLKWMSSENHGVAFTNGIKHVNNTLEIPESGLYFVYTAITVDFRTEEQVPLIYHNVSTKHPRLPLSGSTLRLMNKHGGSTMSDKVHTSFLCGVMYLMRGYQIETQISDIVYIKDDVYSSYFGIFKL